MWNYGQRSPKKCANLGRIGQQAKQKNGKNGFQEEKS